MKIEKVKYKDGEVREKIIVNTKEDNCPVCDAPLSEVGFSWNIFHGEASSSCCGAPYQMKSYYVDEEKVGKEAKEFVESLDKPNRIQCRIDGKYLVAYRKAFEEIGVKDTSDKRVHERVGELLKSNEDS